MSTHIKAAELAKAIVGSNECKKVLGLKQVIDRNTEYNNKIKSLKIVQENVRSALITGKQPSKVHTDSLKKLYDEAFKNSDMKAYLEAEKSFNEYIAKAIQIVSDKIGESLK